ncbi:MAG: LysE family transporter [Muribaculaceae bacterium]|nr:LysE family translocator [Bacteroidales bacterium]MBQ1486695.1 LysE family transporter [Muribaculaceae bacterium]MBR0493026.1 LysE family transporter [Muribaculaceae bacterium]
MGTILSILIGCVSIGIILSAPMGPIGILCIQRTLNKGRNSGFFTGVGAAASDLFYCLLVGLGISLVTDFIADHVNLLQIIGSIILIVYAVYMIFHNPVSQIKENIDQRDDYMRDTATGFLFTLSNPLIMFLIIPLFARFSFPLPEYRFYHIIIGYASIVLGALLWWSVITFFVDKVRTHFNIRSMWLINRIIGIIILILSLYGLVTGTIAYLQQLNVI